MAQHWTHLNWCWKLFVTTGSSYKKIFFQFYLHWVVACSEPSSPECQWYSTECSLQRYRCCRNWQNCWVVYYQSARECWLTGCLAIKSDRGFVYIVNKTGRKTEPWGTLSNGGTDSESRPRTETNCFLSVNNDLIQVRAVPSVPKYNYSCPKKISWSMVSKAADSMQIGMGCKGRLTSDGLVIDEGWFSPQVWSWMVS